MKLLIRPGAIGDCILSFPVIEALGGGDCEVWLPRPLVPLVTFAQRVRPLAETGIDMVALGDRPAPNGFLENLRRFDSIVSWYGANRPEFREELLRLDLPVEFHAALPPPDYPGHATDFFASQCGLPDGLVARIPGRVVAPRYTVVIHPFSGGRAKNWPLNSYRELARQLQAPVEWTAGPEEELAEATRFGDLADLAEWLTGARLYIGNDSGVTHLAAACGVKTVALFGPTRPATWAPRGGNVTVISQLDVRDVAAAANVLLLAGG